MWTANHTDRCIDLRPAGSFMPQLTFLRCHSKFQWLFLSPLLTTVGSPLSHLWGKKFTQVCGSRGLEGRDRGQV